MQKKIITALIFLIAFTASCTKPSHLSKNCNNYGKSYSALFEAQIINTNAPKNRTPVNRTPGYKAIRIYNDSYLSNTTRLDN